MTDYYSLLEVPRDAAEAVIKRAYRKLAMQYHPDRNNGDKDSEARFKEITEAYEVLRDPGKRSIYDHYGEAGLKGRAGQAQGFHAFDLSEALNIFMRDFGGFSGFEELFGGGRQGGPSERRGNDLRAAVSLGLDDVARGTKKTLRYQVLVPCEACAGSGAKRGTSPRTCGTCGGAGQVRRAQRSVFGQFVTVGPCPTCAGEGRIIAVRCDICRGDGRTRVDRTVNVDVPPGVSSENYITMRGQGHAGPRGGTAGDLIVMLEVEDDPRFVRHGDDLVYDLPLSFSQAALGADVVVPTPWGDEPVKVSPGTQAGTTMRLKGRGLPHLGSASKGDVHVRVGIWTPERLTPELERVFRELAKHEGEAPASRDGRSFWDRMKEALGA
ncbi:MAG: molecular chaperone DnaJ [Gemmatimonadales bacterium]|nr:molecular chaperone DnaJ [Gemmatimonadales bacterium]